MRLGLRLSQPLGPFPTCILSMLLAALAVYVSAYMPTFESTSAPTQHTYSSPSRSSPSSRASPSSWSSRNVSSTTPSTGCSSTVSSSWALDSDMSYSDCSTTTAATHRTSITRTASLAEILISSHDRFRDARNKHATWCSSSAPSPSHSSTPLSPSTANARTSNAKTRVV